MPTRVQLPDGNVGEFPDGMSQDQIEAVLKKQFPTPNAAPQPLERTFGNYLTEAAAGIGRGLSNIASGVVDTGKMILDPAGTMVRGVQDPGSNPAVALAKAGKAGYDEFKQTQGTPLGKRLIAAGLTGMEQAPMIGPMVQHAEQGGTQMASPESVGAAAEGTTTIEAPGIAGRVIPPAFRRGAEMISGTGPKVASDLAKETAETNSKATAKAAAKQATQDAQRTQELQKFYDKTHPEPPTSLETGRPRTAAELQSHKQALSQGLERLDSEFQSDLTDTQERVRQQAGAKYDDVRAKVGDAVAPESALADAVRNAEKNISGSKERIGVFQDILKQHPESTPDFMDYQGAKIPRGHPLYDVLNEQGANAGGPTTFSDLQGYYSELGSKLARGGMPDDVFRAVRDLHSDIGNMMQRMADDAGVGPDFADARKFYRGYMETFRNSSSPIYKAVNATERGKSVAALAGKDITGIEALATYDPQLARRANTLRDYQTEANSIPKPKVQPYKPPPQLSPKPAPVQANLQTITPEQVAAAKAEALETRAGHIAGRGSWIAAWPLYHAFSAIVRGAPTELGMMGMESGATLAGTQAIARILQNPHAVDFLSKATPRDLAAIPPELRSGNWQPIIDAAKTKGIPISPAVAAMVAAPRPQHPTLSAASPVQ